MLVANPEFLIALRSLFVRSTIMSDPSGLRVELSPSPISSVVLSELLR